MGHTLTRTCIACKKAKLLKEFNLRFYTRVCNFCKSVRGNSSTPQRFELQGREAIMSINKIQDMVDQHVKQRSKELLEEARPQVEKTVRATIKKHLDQIIAERVEVTLASMQPVAERTARLEIFQQIGADDNIKVEVEKAPLTPSMVQDILSQAMDPITAARGIKKVRGAWVCAFCNETFDTERGATHHTKWCKHRNSLLTDLPIKPKRQSDVVKKKNGKDTRRKRRECIKPDCHTPSRGPKYHHLCETHEGSSEKNVLAWQRKIREERAEEHA